MKTHNKMSTTDIKNNPLFKRVSSKKPNWIRVYEDGNFTAKRKHKRENEPYLIEVLMNKIGLNMKQSILVSSAMNNVNQKDEDNNRFAANTGGSYYKLDKDIKEQFFEEFEYSGGKKNGQLIGYRVKNSEDIESRIYEFIDEFKTKARSKGNKPLNKYLHIIIEDYKKMSLYTKLHLLNSLVYAKNDMLYVDMRHSQEIGNIGRRYNIINEIPREDRKKMTNLYGIDMNTALQAILYQDIKRLEPNINLPLLRKQIKNRSEVREEVRVIMKYETTLEAKLLMVAILMGKWYHGGYKEIKGLFNERDRIAKIVVNEMWRDEDSEKVRYAIRRTSEKILEKCGKEMNREDYEKEIDKDIKTHFRNSFMFFYWTYTERRMQNVIAGYFENPITLHDGVYTQDRKEIEAISINEVEDKIREETGYGVFVEIE